LTPGNYRFAASEKSSEFFNTLEIISVIFHRTKKYFYGGCEIFLSIIFSTQIIFLQFPAQTVLTIGRKSG